MTPWGRDPPVGELHSRWVGHDPRRARESWWAVTPPGRDPPVRELDLWMSAAFRGVVTQRGHVF